jgi:hypothetical protein
VDRPSLLMVLTTIRDAISPAARLQPSPAIPHVDEHHDRFGRDHRMLGSLASSTSAKASAILADSHTAPLKRGFPPNEQDSPTWKRSKMSEEGWARIAAQKK